MIPNESSLRNFFEKFWSTGDAGECIQAANDVFLTLDSYYKKCVFISGAEVHVKPAIHYRDDHVIRFSQNRLTLTPAKTVFNQLC